MSKTSAGIMNIFGKLLCIVIFIGGLWNCVVPIAALVYSYINKSYYVYLDKIYLHFGIGVGLLVILIIILLINRCRI